MDENPTTEFWEHIEAPEKPESRDGLPEKLFQLRQKLGHKAKQEPKFPLLHVVWADTLADHAGGGLETGASE